MKLEREEQRYLFYFYVPISHLELVKGSIIAAGAGLIGNYEGCLWQTKGDGQFCPLPGSSPYIGEKGKMVTLEEMKVETVVLQKHVKAVSLAFKQSHPYEEPAYGWVKLEKVTIEE